MAHDAGRKGDEAVHVTGIALRAGRDVGRRLAQCIDGRVGPAVASRALAGQPCMVHPRRFECGVIRMTGIALGAGGNMRCRLAEHGCTVVAGRAVTGCRGRVGIGSASPGGRRPVTGVTLSRGRNVGGCFGLGIDCHVGPAMATRTVAGSCRPGGAAVAHGRRREGGGVCVTGIALGRGRNVIGRLAQGRRAVVAGRATARDCGRGSGMIEGGSRPGNRRVVAGIALGRGRNMGRGFYLRILGNESAAVTGRARTLEAGVTHHRWRPSHKASGVAAIALGNSRNMVHRFGQRIGENVAAAMAGGTLARRSCMAHPRRLEGRKAGVAGIALRAGGDVVGRLAQRRCAVVTRGAPAVGAGIVRVNSRCPGSRGVMASIALSAGADVRHRLDLGILGEISAAVAGRTQAVQPAVVHGSGAPVDETADVAGIALGGTGNVIDRALQRIGEEIRPIVTGRALAGHAAVIHLGRLEGGEVGVATVALRPRGDMG